MSIDPSKIVFVRLEETIHLKYSLFATVFRQSAKSFFFFCIDFIHYPECVCQGSDCFYWLLFFFVKAICIVKFCLCEHGIPCALEKRVEYQRIK